MKICGNCKQEKEIGEFGSYFDKRTQKMYSRSSCLSCKAAQQRQWRSGAGRKYFLDWKKKNYYINREEILQRKKENHQKLRLEALEYYGNGKISCACCDESILEFLVLDHENGGGNKHRKEIGKKLIYIWMKQNNYPKGFRILCHNCNYSLGSWGYCPHQKKRL